jgi:hypothetical protein
MLGFLIGMALGVIVTLCLIYVLVQIINNWNNRGGEDEEGDDGFEPEPPKGPPPSPSGGSPDREPKIAKQLQDAIADRFDQELEDEEEDDSLQPIC